MPEGLPAELLPAACVPNDHSRQMTAELCTQAIIEEGFSPQTVLDLGCGEGKSASFFHQHAPGARWIGVDIEDSVEVRLRTRTGAEFMAYDGIHIPLDDNAMDLIFCRQVFEHVRYPEPLLAQIHRVLKPGGRLILSASFLEPYHSHSRFGYTPFGFHDLLRDANLIPLAFRPGADGLSLIIRRLMGNPGITRRWVDRQSPLNHLIELWGKLRRRSPQWRNLKKLQYCGHFCVIAGKKP